MCGPIGVLVFFVVRQAMHLGGYKFGGHTELLQKHSGAKSSRLCLASPSSGLVVVHATCHIPFKDVAARIGDPGRILETVRLTRLFCRQMGFRAHGAEPKARPRSLSLRAHTHIAVCAAVVERDASPSIETEPGIFPEPGIYPSSARKDRI